MNEENNSEENEIRNQASRSNFPLSNTENTNADEEVDYSLDGDDQLTEEELDALMLELDLDELTNYDQYLSEEESLSSEEEEEFASAIALPDFTLPDIVSIEAFVPEPLPTIDMVSFDAYMYDNVLETLYGKNEAENMAYKLENLDNQNGLDSVTDNEGNELKPKEAVKWFLLNVKNNIADEIIYKPETKRLLGSILQEEAKIEDRNLALKTLAISLGNCPTPSNELLVQNYIGKCLSEKENLSIFEETILEREAIKEYMSQDKLKGLYKGIETIEQTNALLNTLYLEESEATKYGSPFKIEGDRYRLSSISPNKKFGFSQLEHLQPLVHEFLKAVCKTDAQGEVIKNNKGAYSLDRSKINALSEKYMAKMGIISPKERAIDNCKIEIEKLLVDNLDFITDNMHIEEVVALLDTLTKINDLRNLLSKTPASEILNTCNTFLEDYQTDINGLISKPKLDENKENKFKALGGSPINIEQKNHSKRNERSSTPSKTKSQGKSI